MRCCYIHKRTIIIILGLIILFNCELTGQKKDYRFNYFTIEDGLSQNLVDCIFKDSRGFMWFGTWNGLNRFDGYTFRTYKADVNDPGSISDNFVYDIEEDQYGNLWIGTANGLNVYLHQQDIFILYSFDPASSKHICSDKINTLMIDAHGDLWIGTDVGIDRITILNETGQIGTIEHFSSGYVAADSEDLNVNTLFEDESGKIWIGSNSGLAILDREDQNYTVFSFQSENIYSLSNNEVQAILQDRNGAYWIGTRSGLNRFDYQAGRFYRYVNDASDQFSLIHNSIESIVLDINGELILGTLGGLSIYNREENNFYNYTYHQHAVSELNNEFVNSLFADLQGNIWIGTDRGGINKFNVYQNEFDYHISTPALENSLSSNTINSIWEDDEALWVGTAGGGLNRIDNKTGSYRHYLSNPDQPGSISNNFVTSIHRDIIGNLWIGTWGGGINILSNENESEGVFNNMVNDPADPYSLINNFISSIVEDRQGRIWIGTYGGLVRYDPELNRFENFSARINGMEISKVGCLNFDIYNNLWVGTEEGLYLVPSENNNQFKLDLNRIEKFVYNAEQPNSISGNYIISIYDDNQGNIWFGSYGNGLNRLSLDSLRLGYRNFKRYKETDGLCNNTIYGIQEDDNGNIWVSTDNGLSRLDQTTNRFVNFYVVDGLLGNQFYWSASFKNLSGKLYFGSMNGLLSFFPDRITEKTFDPSVILTDLKIYGQSVEIGTEYYDAVTLNRPIYNKEKIVLSYKIKEFTIDFSALYYEHPEKVHYAYQLEGFDPDWRYVDSKRRFASYTNLKGGNYTFMVKASINKDIFESSPHILQIVIAPPFWVKTWFIITVILVVLAAVLVFYWYRVYALHKRQKALEIQVQQRTAQIKGQNEQLEIQNIEILQQRDKLIELNKKVQQSNQQQMRFFTHMSHEFRTPLTLIISPIEQIMKGMNAGSRNYSRLMLVKRNAQRLLHLINQLMEVRRIKTGNIELKVTRSNIADFVQNISLSFNGLANHKNILYEFHSNPDEINIYFDQEKVENIMYNLLSNAFKYTPDGGQVFIDIRKVKKKLELDGDIAIISNVGIKDYTIKEFVEINVIDTGYGIDPDELKSIFKRFYRIPVSGVPDVQGTGIGLYLTKELIKIHKGLLYINSKPGEGTTFSILLSMENIYQTIDQTVDPEPELKGIPKLHIDLLAEQLYQNGDNLLSDAMNIVNPSSQQVLIIDDDSDMRSFMADYLGGTFKVITAADGAEGLKKVTSHNPDIIISDIMMPGIDGLELCTRLKSDIRTSHIPIILLTARSEVEDFMEGLDAGAVDYIAKPFDINILEKKVISLIENQFQLKKLYASNNIEDIKNIKKVQIQDHFLVKSISIIEENLYNAQFGVKELAKELCISRSLLHKKLISSVDQSANSFINSIRLKRAALLLLEGNKKVAEIAFEVGFNDPKYFSKSFKRNFGKSPSEFVEINISNP